MLGLHLFLVQVLNLKLVMSLPDRKVPFKLQIPKWLLFASTVCSDLISAVPVVFCRCSRLPHTSSFACTFYSLGSIFIEKQSDVTSFVRELVEQNRNCRGACAVRSRVGVAAFG